MDISSYYLAKLHDINYRIAINPGDANRRLGSQADKILVISAMKVPKRFDRQFHELIGLIESSYGSNPVSLVLIGLRGKHNSTAAKYIKLLLDIEEALMSD